MARQGQTFSEQEVRRIEWFLSSTEMTLNEIATRMSCSHSAVASINRKLQIRDYAGRRSVWQKADAEIVAV